MLNESTRTISQKASARILCLVDAGGNRPQRANQRDDSQRSLATAVAHQAVIHQRIEHHDDHAENRKHDFRQNADVIDDLRKRVRSRIHRPTTLLASWLKGANTF